MGKPTLFTKEKNMNKLIISGNVGKDPEILETRNGGKLAKFSVATSERWKNKEGEQQEETVWHNVVVFNKGLVSLCEMYVTKGMRLIVEGKQVNRKYEDKEGNARYASELQIPNFGGNIELPPKGAASTETLNKLQLKSVAELITSDPIDSKDVPW